MAGQIQTLQDVVDWGLCTGCGACYYACDKQAVTLVNIESVGIRPRFDDACQSCTSCLSICPGYQVDANLATGQVPKTQEADHEFGPALEIWEGHATDPEIRYQGSSGGLLSALALYCLERENMEFVLHAGMDEAKPWTNKTVQSRTRAEILTRTASRYAPASPCEGLEAIEQSPRPCVFIGKPCDTAAVTMLRQQRPALDQKLGLVLAFFCAGTPSTQGTVDLIHSLEVTLPQVDTVRYRGEGWPGGFKVIYDDRKKEKSLTYLESWGKLTKHRPLRCNLCPDGLGRVADITCGDAWESFKDAGERHGPLARGGADAPRARNPAPGAGGELRAIGPGGRAECDGGADQSVAEKKGTFRPAHRASVAADSSHPLQRLLAVSQLDTAAAGAEVAHPERNRGARCAARLGPAPGAFPDFH